MRADPLEEDEYGAYIIIKRRRPPGPSTECASTSPFPRRYALLPLNNQARFDSRRCINAKLVNYYPTSFSYRFLVLNMLLTL